MKVALASPNVASTLDEGLEKTKLFMSEAADKGAHIICFPEAYLPGLRGHDFEVLPFAESEQAQVLEMVRGYARTYAIVTIYGMERITETGRQVAAVVIDTKGRILGYQTKNQLAPAEEQFYVPGSTRQLFEVKGVKFGIAICHEGWRYPETVRWAAVRGAKVVFHPQLTGSNRKGVKLASWGSADGPYYEKAMMMRSKENAIYFASVNYAMRFQESATSIINPFGECQAYLPYGEEGLLVEDIDPEQATGLFAMRYAPRRYEEVTRV